jgi:HNH endonuclease
MAIGPKDRFWKHVDKRGPDECWPWTGNLSHNGYGQLRGETRNSTVRASHISYELHYGTPVPKGLSCLHHCDNPKCVNPIHLFTGTQADNIADKMKKDRGAYGVKHGRAKLSPIKIKAAKLYRENGWSWRKIADRFNVSAGAVRHALIGMTWQR